MFRYDFYYKDISNITLLHYVRLNDELTNDQRTALQKILANFPHSKEYEWHIKFSQFNPELYDNHILRIAANARDGIGNPVLSIACERGEPIEAIQALITMGAELDTLYNNKLALHWAITNKIANYNINSNKALMPIKCLLDNGAKTNIKCYLDMTPLQYARSRKYEAAASLIAKHIQDKTKAYYRGSIFGLFGNKLPKDNCNDISELILM